MVREDTNQGNGSIAYQYTHNIVAKYTGQIIDGRPVFDTKKGGPQYGGKIESKARKIKN